MVCLHAAPGLVRIPSCCAFHRDVPAARLRSPRPPSTLFALCHSVLGLIFLSPLRPPGRRAGGETVTELASGGRISSALADGIYQVALRPQNRRRCEVMPPAWNCRAALLLLRRHPVVCSRACACWDQNALSILRFWDWLFLVCVSMWTSRRHISQYLETEHSALP